MKTILIISLLILQSSASFLDVFAPVESSFGKLVTDVVTDIRETIDCTILAVEHVFSLGGLFGDNSDYDEKCKGQKRTTVSGNSPEMAPYSYKTEESHIESHKQTVKEKLTQQIHESVSEANEKIKNILDLTHAQEKMENVKASLKSESDRLEQISALLRQELEKLPEKIRKNINLEENRPCLDNLLKEIKLLYQVEQKGKTSAEANEVRHVFDEVLNVLQVNDTGGPLSDEGEVKTIIQNLGKVTNDSLVDVEKQVSQWTEEQNKDLRDIKDVVLTTNNEKLTIASRINNDEIMSTSATNIGKDVINEKLDEIEKEQEKIVDFSHNLKELAKNILNKVSEYGTPHSVINEMNTPILNKNEDFIPSKASHFKEDTASIIDEKLDQIKKEQKEVLEVSETLKNFTKNILDKVSVPDSTNIQSVKLNTKSNDSLTPAKVQKSNLSVSWISSSTDDVHGVVNSQLDKIEQKQKEMIDVSQNLQILANDILNNVNQTNTSDTDIESASTAPGNLLEKSKRNNGSASEEASRVTNEKLDKMEKDVEEIDDVSHNLKNLSKDLLDKVSEDSYKKTTFVKTLNHTNGTILFPKQNSTLETSVKDGTINSIDVQQINLPATSATTSTKVIGGNILISMPASDIATLASSTSKIDGQPNIVITQLPKRNALIVAQTAPTQSTVSNQKILLSESTETIQISPLQQTMPPLVSFMLQHSQNIERGPTDKNSAASASTPQPQVTSPLPVETTLRPSRFPPTKQPSEVESVTSITTETSKIIWSSPETPIITPQVTTRSPSTEKTASIPTLTVDIKNTTSSTITQATEATPVSTEPSQTTTLPTTTSTVTTMVMFAQHKDLPHTTTVPVIEPITQATIASPSVLPISTEPPQTTTFLPTTTSTLHPVIISPAITELPYKTSVPVIEPYIVPTLPPPIIRLSQILPDIKLAPEVRSPSTTQPPQVLPLAPVTYPPVQIPVIFSTSTLLTPTKLPTPVSTQIPKIVPPTSKPSPQTVPLQTTQATQSVLPLPPVPATPPPPAFTYPPTFPTTRQPSQQTFPTTFKEAARQITENTKTVTMTEEVVNDYVEPQAGYDDESLFNAFRNGGIDMGDVDSSVFNELFGYQNVAEQRAAMQDAKKLVQQSKMTSNVMNLFRNGEEINAANIFNNPDLLNFGGDFALNQR